MGQVGAWHGVSETRLTSCRLFYMSSLFTNCSKHCRAVTVAGMGVTLIACLFTADALLVVTLISERTLCLTVSCLSAERNKEPILQELRQLLPQEGMVLEVATGTGQHISHFAAALPSLQWQPTDVSDEGFDSIRAYNVQLPNVLPPLVLDASLPPEQWPVQGPCAAVLAANVTHISPWCVVCQSSAAVWTACLHPSYNTALKHG